MKAEKQIKLLREQAKEQRLKAEKIIQKTITSARKEVDQKLVRLRAAEKAIKAMGKDIKQQAPIKKRSSTSTNQVVKKNVEKKRVL